MTTRQREGSSPQQGRNASGQSTTITGRERDASDQTGLQTEYWREQYQSEPYYNQGKSFDQYEPAFRIGIEGRSQHAGQRFEDVENTLRRDYENNRGTSSLGWNQGASQACRAAWNRAEQSAPSDRDRQSSKR